MVSEADEAAGLSPGNEENEADRCFSPEKPCLPLPTEGTATHYTAKPPGGQEKARPADPRPGNLYRLVTHVADPSGKAPVPVRDGGWARYFGMP